jgi:hypothetical protein
MATIGELAAEFETLVRIKKNAADTESQCNKDIERVQQQLLDMMSDEGLPSIKMDSGMTLFRRCEKYYGVAEGHEKDELVNALANCDLTRDLVSANYNANTLRSRMAEIEANGEVLPEEVTRLLKLTEKYKVGHRS